MFKPQLGEDITKLQELKKPEQQVIQLPKIGSFKLDGIRTLTKYGTALSRSLKPVPNHHIREILNHYPDLDGEVIIGEPTAKDCYRTTNSAWSSHGGTPEFRFFVFDELSQPKLPFKDRLNILAERQLPDFIVRIEQVDLHSTDEVDAFYQRALNLRYEGIMLRNNVAYVNGRCSAISQNMLKGKPFADDDAEIISVYEAMHNANEAFVNELGQTDRSTHKENKIPMGMLGGFTARDLKTNVVFDVAPGRSSHAERREWWENRHALPGRFLKYRRMVGGEKDKPRHGRFIGWRDKADL